MKLLLLLILLDTPQHIMVFDSHILEQRREIIDAEMPIRTPMRFSRSGSMLREDLLT